MLALILIFIVNPDAVKIFSSLLVILSIQKLVGLFSYAIMCYFYFTQITHGCPTLEHALPGILGCTTAAKENSTYSSICIWKIEVEVEAFKKVLA